MTVFRRDIYPASSVQSISRGQKLNHYFVAWAETFKFFCTLPDSTAGGAVDVACYLSVRSQTFLISGSCHIGKEGNSAARNWISCNIQVISEGRTEDTLINK